MRERGVQRDGDGVDDEPRDAPDMASCGGERRGIDGSRIEGRVEFSHKRGMEIGDEVLEFGTKLDANGCGTPAEVAGGEGDRESTVDGPLVNVRETCRAGDDLKKKRGVVDRGTEDGRTHCGAVAGGVDAGLTDAQTHADASARGSEADTGGKRKKPADEPAPKRAFEHVGVARGCGERKDDERGVVGVVGDHAAAQKQAEASGGIEPCDAAVRKAFEGKTEGVSDGGGEE